MKFILTGYFVLLISISLHAGEGMIFYGDAKIYGKENLFVKQTTPSKPSKAVTKVKEKKPAPAENEITEQEAIPVVFPTFPFEPSSSSFLHGSCESAVVSPQQRVGSDEQSDKIYNGNAYPDIKNSDLSIYNPEQRQKLSIAATQCGELTSFGAQSPPVPLNPLKGLFYS